MASNYVEAQHYCDDCSNLKSTRNFLSCDTHSICQDCFLERVKTQPQDLLGSLHCKCKKYSPSYSFSDAAQHEPVITDATPEISDIPVKKDAILPGIWIFVDDSNIWIEAKKLQSKKKQFKTCEDHRVRIDMGKLADVIADGRPVKQGVLYGSEPPPVDTVWNKIRKKGFRVEPKRRSKISGKEKQVDTKLVAEVTRTAIKTPQFERSTIVVVTGDADVIPALEEAIAEEGWNIEVYMWKQAVAGDLKKYAKEHEDRVQIRDLDDCLDYVAFTNIKFPIATNKELKSRVNESGVVFSMEPNAFGTRVPDNAWCKQLENIAQWPFQYYWFQIDKEPTDDLVIVFPPDKVGKFDCKNFLATIEISEITGDSNPKYYLPKVKKAQTFLTFVRNKFKDEPDEVLKQFDVALEQVGVYDHDAVYDGYNSDQSYVSDNEDKWSTVRLKKRQPRKQQYSELCSYKFNCRYRTNCQNKHTEEEKQYFKKRGGKKIGVRKVKECKNFLEKRCMSSKMECDCAHGEEDAWCLQCRSTGHFTKNCPEKLSSGN